ncbi:MAG: DUF551 domain-containing protein [Candidatus Marinimicrobia bacterium]|nr:DUF551 domain-containing protein [Candidatus Neomarinimicrobiota bacterium]
MAERTEFAFDNPPDLREDVVEVVARWVNRYASKGSDDAKAKVVASLLTELEPYIAKGGRLCIPWISVDVDMPDEDTDVFVLNDGYIYVGGYGWDGMETEKMWTMTDARGKIECALPQVTHWAHLPEDKDLPT